jgi:hypothetical protein
MPVKVRCPECQKVLTLPDQARGKTAKCPDCEARVPVPGVKKKAMPPRSPAAAGAKKDRPAARGEESEDELFAKLDLSRAEDQQTRVCPKCGVPVEEEDIECPKCGVTLTTGRLSAERLRKKERGGPDTDKYYERFWKTGLDFVKEHWKFGLRTMLYLMVASAICMLAGFMTLYTSKLPLKVFWGAIFLLFAFMGPGWCWFLHTTLIQSAIDKKVKLDRVRFDFFTCVALGIKFLCWLIVFCAPFQVVFGTIGGLMISNDMLPAGIAVIALGFLPGFFCFPVTMSHMAMPVEWQGWLSPRILPQYFQGMVAPSMYWCMFCAGSMLPSAIFVLIAVFAFEEELSTLVTDLNHNARVAHVMEYEEPKKKSSGEETTEIEGQIETQLNAFSWWFSATKEQKISERKYYAGDAVGGGTGGTDDAKPEWEREIDAESVIAPAVLWILAIAPFGFAAVFNMRTSGLFTYYFRTDLQLIALEKLVFFKRKAKGVLDDEGR